jgi:hypothetical protein
MLTRIEALADAISYYNQSHDLDSPAYKNRNPGNLKAFSFRHIRDDDGRRVFNSLLDGYQALLFDIRIKAQGKSHAKLGDGTISSLMKAYGHDGIAVGAYIAKRVRKALGDESIKSDTPITYFLEVV